MSFVLAARQPDSAPTCENPIEIVSDAAPLAAGSLDAEPEHALIAAIAATESVAIPARKKVFRFIEISFSWVPADCRVIGAECGITVSVITMLALTFQGGKSRRENSFLPENVQKFLSPVPGALH